LIHSPNINWAELLLDNGFDLPPDGKEYSAICPFHYDTSPSLSINLEKEVWICFSGCGAGTLMTFFQRLLNKTPTEIIQAKQESDLSLDFLFENIQPKEPEPMVQISMPEGLLYDKFPNWVYDRGFSKELLMRFGCGTDENRSLVIPAKTRKGKLVGTITRRRQLQPKYLYSKNFRKSRILFGADHITKTDKLYLVEGSLDAIWLHQNGYPAVALLGMSLSKKQEELLLGLPISEVVLCLDNDEAGKKGKQQALKKLQHKIATSFISLPDGAKDVQDLGTSRLDKTMKKRLYFTTHI